MSVRIENLSVRLGEFHLRDIALAAEAGEYFVLLGPSGAGKTVLLECIAGLCQPDSGRILLDGRDVVGMPLEHRGIGFVPQDYALFPNMTVAQNIAFGPRSLRLPAAEINSRTNELLSLLRIETLANRLPLTLSGGEQQRAALARALAVRPKVLLLDEPLAALDESTRWRLCAELRQLPAKTGIVVIHVCHDFEEMLAVADHTAVMNAGQIEQTGLPGAILRRPANRFVAEFARCENIFPVARYEECAEGTLVSIAPSIMLRTSAAPLRVNGFAVVRPENVAVGADVEITVDHPIAAVVTQQTDRGGSEHIRCVAQDCVEWSALRSRREADALPLHIGDKVRLVIRPEHVMLIPSDS